jgi:hypothetical protein
MSYYSSNLTWYEAYQRCRDDGQDLLQNSNEKYVEKYTDGRTYWVSFFRRTTMQRHRQDKKQSEVKQNKKYNTENYK